MEASQELTTLPKSLLGRLSPLRPFFFLQDSNPYQSGPYAYKADQALPEDYDTLRYKWRPMQRPGYIADYVDLATRFNTYMKVDIDSLDEANKETVVLAFQNDSEVSREGLLKEVLEADEEDVKNALDAALEEYSSYTIFRYSLHNPTEDEGFKSNQELCDFQDLRLHITKSFVKNVHKAMMDGMEGEHRYVHGVKRMRYPTTHGLNLYNDWLARTTVPDQRSTVTRPDWGSDISTYDSYLLRLELLRREQRIKSGLISDREFEKDDDKVLGFAEVELCADAMRLMFSAYYGKTPNEITNSTKCETTQISY